VRFVIAKPTPLRAGGPSIFAVIDAFVVTHTSINSFGVGVGDGGGGGGSGSWNHLGIGIGTVPCLLINEPIARCLTFIL